MALVNTISIPPEYEELWAKSCVLRGGFYGQKVDKKYIEFRKRNFDSLIARSEFQSIASKWNDLTATEQENWGNAGYWASMSGWDLFAQDTIYRINNGLLGVATPNEYHQFKVGKLTIEAPAQSCKIRMPLRYTMNSLFEWAINFEQLLSIVEEPASANFQFYWSELDGGDYYYWYENYNVESDDGWSWWNDAYDISAGPYYLYFVEIEILNMRGILYFDGLFFLYNDVNIAKDWQCNDVENNWTKVLFPAGCKLETVYPPDE